MIPLFFLSAPTLGVDTVPSGDCLTHHSTRPQHDLERTHEVSQLIETLARELERPREVPDRIVDNIWSTHEIDLDEVGAFLETGMADLEEHEYELILSPLFTPKLTDQVVFAELLGVESVPREDWPALVEQLEARPTRAELVTREGDYRVALQEVILERYVYRLRLDGAIPEPVWSLIDQDAFTEESQLFKAIARRAIWDTDARRNILATYLSGAARDGLYADGDCAEFLQLAEDFKPRDMDHLMGRIPQLQKSLQEDIDSEDNPKPFFSDQIQANHGFDRDQRKQDDGRLAAKKNELAFLDRLHQALTG